VGVRAEQAEQFYAGVACCANDAGFDFLIHDFSVGWALNMEV